MQSGTEGGKELSSQGRGKMKPRLVLCMNEEQRSALQTEGVTWGEAGRGNVISTLLLKHIC